MKEIARKLAALGLSLGLLLGCAACGGQSAGNAQRPPEAEGFSAEDTLEAEPNPIVTEQPEETPAEEPAQEPASPAQEPAATGLDPKEIVLTVNGEGVTWEEFRYWLYAGLSYQGIAIDENTDWDQIVYGELTMRDYALQDALHSAILYKVVDQSAAEKGIVATEENMEEIEGIIQSNIQYVGGEDAYLEYLTANYLTDELMRSMLLSSFHYSDLFAEMFGSQGEKLSDEEAILFGSENNYFRAKHILMANEDAEGNPLDEEAMAEKLRTLEGVLAELKEAEDPVAVFDARMWDFSEDPGLSTNPEGYLFRRGEMVQAFQDAVEALEDYAFSDIVEMEYGYTIVMRLPLDPDGVAVSDASYGYTLRYNAASSIFNSIVESWISEAQVEYTAAYEQIDPATAW